MRAALVLLVAALAGLAAWWVYYRAQAAWRWRRRRPRCADATSPAALAALGAHVARLPSEIQWAVLAHLAARPGDGSHPHRGLGAVLCVSRAAHARLAPAGYREVWMTSPWSLARLRHTLALLAPSYGPHIRVLHLCMGCETPPLAVEQLLLCVPGLACLDVDAATAPALAGSQVQRLRAVGRPRVARWDWRAQPEDARWVYAWTAWPLWAHVEALELWAPPAMARAAAAGAGPRLRELVWHPVLPADAPLVQEAAAQALWKDVLRRWTQRGVDVALQPPVRREA